MDCVSCVSSKRNIFVHPRFCTRHNKDSYLVKMAISSLASQYTIFSVPIYAFLCDSSEFIPASLPCCSKAAICIFDCLWRSMQSLQREVKGTVAHKQGLLCSTSVAFCCLHSSRRSPITEASSRFTGATHEYCSGQ